MVSCYLSSPELSAVGRGFSPRSRVSRGVDAKDPIPARYPSAFVRFQGEPLRPAIKALIIRSEHRYNSTVLGRFLCVVCAFATDYVSIE